jgi:hypothetical protein
MVRRNAHLSAEHLAVYAETRDLHTEGRDGVFTQISRARERELGKAASQVPENFRRKERDANLDSGIMSAGDRKK